MFTPRTSPVERDEEPFAWNVLTEYQCTWFCYGESIRFASPCCWWDRATKTGSYANAKEWLENYRDPWVVKDKDYNPVQGDIAVFDGEYGHVQFMETDIMYAEYSFGDPKSFKTGKFVKKSNLLGFLHYPLERVDPVERNENVPQIETTDTALRIRTSPSLRGEIVGHVKLGYYNALSEKESDGYTWYEIAEGRWCADVTTKYLPSTGSDVIRRIEEYFNSMKSEINTLTKERNKYKEVIKEVHKLTEADV